MKFLRYILGLGLILVTLSTGAQTPILGQVTPGTYVPVQVNAGGLLVGYGLGEAIGFSDVPNLRRVTALGFNPDIDVATIPEDVWPGGGLYPWLTVATSLEIVSTSVADAAAGTGARTFQVGCLDAAYVETTEIVTLNGVTAVPLTKQCLRINSLVLLTAGTGKTNAGDVSVRDAGGGTVRSIAPAGYGLSRQAIYTVPAGYTLQIISIYIAGLAATGATTNFDVSTFTQTSTGVYRLPITLTTGSTGVYRHDGIPGIILAEKTDFALRVTFANLNNTIVTAAFLGIMKKN
jgi:hypothetical protein